MSDVDVLLKKALKKLWRQVLWLLLLGAASWYSEGASRFVVVWLLGGLAYELGDLASLGRQLLAHLGRGDDAQEACRWALLDEVAS
jgi:hypothetical protein